MYSHAATTIPANDVQEPIDFYADKLGFRCTFLWKESATYVVLNYNDNINIHLSKSDKKVIPGSQVLLYIFVYDVDAVYENLVSKNVEIRNSPTTLDYGMRDFDIVDNTWHQLSLGMGV